MSYKTLMQTLLGRFYAKSEKKTVAVLGWPTSNSTEVSLDVSSGEATYVSPVDGWCHVAAICKNVSGYPWCGTYTSSKVEVSSNFPKDSSASVNYALPVRKGESVRSYFGQLQQLKYEFIENVASGGVLTT